MIEVLGPIYDAVNLTEDALKNAATLTAAAYGAGFSEMTNELKWRVLAEFYALNVAVNYATTLVKFTADDTTVDASAMFQHIQDRWRNALAMAQTYLAESGITVVAPGAPISPRNYGFRIGSMNMNYLVDEGVQE
jgi:hypothetical protein